jgi:hypothetical protein
MAGKYGLTIGSPCSIKPTKSFHPLTDIKEFFDGIGHCQLGSPVTPSSAIRTPGDIINTKFIEFSRSWDGLALSKPWPISPSSVNGRTASHILVPGLNTRIYTSF